MEQIRIDDKQTTIHEAGHAVAHCRLEIFQAYVSFDSEKIYDEDGNLKSSTLGRAVGEGWEHVCDQVQAGDQVLAYYAGYAALLAVGYGAEQASVGAEDDFFLASHLLEAWEIGEEDEWKQKAELLMRDKANVAAVARVAEELLWERHLVMDQVKMLIDVADGEMSEEEYQRMKQAFWKC